MLKREAKDGEVGFLFVGKGREEGKRSGRKRHEKQARNRVQFDDALLDKFHTLHFYMSMMLQARCACDRCVCNMRTMLFI